MFENNEWPAAGADEMYGDTGHKHFDAIVLGAGISGLVSVSILLQQGYRRVLIIDEFEHLGGNHIDYTSGDYTFDVGSYIFQDDSPLIKHFPELLPHYVEINPSWSKLNPAGRVTQYPIGLNDDFVKSGPLNCLQIILSVVWCRITTRRISSARDFAEYWLGRHFLKTSGLENYMARFCGVPAERVDLDFAEKRMMWIQEHASLKFLFERFRRLFRRSGPLAVANRQLVRPVAGFAALYAVAATRLQQQGACFQLGHKVKTVRRMGARFVVQTNIGVVSTERVVSTIPIDMMLNLCGFVLPYTFSYVTLISLFFSFRGRRGFRQSVLYNFSYTGSWKRLTVYSDFYGRSSEGREYFGVEVVEGHDGTEMATAEASFRTHVARNGLFVGDLRLEGSRRVPNAYPIYTEQAQSKVTDAIAQLRHFGVESFGRQGAFNYQPTARVSTLDAEAVLAEGPIRIPR